VVKPGQLAELSLAARRPHTPMSPCAVAARLQLCLDPMDNGVVSCGEIWSRVRRRWAAAAAAAAAAARKHAVTAARDLQQLLPQSTSTAAKRHSWSAAGTPVTGVWHPRAVAARSCPSARAPMDAQLSQELADL